MPTVSELEIGLVLKTTGEKLNNFYVTPGKLLSWWRLQQTVQRNCGKSLLLSGSRMAGPGMALRLHEFKETSSPNTAASSRVTRQGRDTLGIYPGQVGRVHVTSSANHRVRSAWRVDLEGQYPVAFDLQTLRTLQVYRNTSGLIEHSAATSYQEAFGSLSCLYLPSDRKYTAVSHPGPLRPSDPAAI